MSDFLDEPKFSKGKAKPQELKAWQERDSKGKIIHKGRCWDGLLGCEEWFSRTAFRWHPRLCERCVVALSSRYEVPQKDIDILALLLAQDNGLIVYCRYLKAEESKLKALEDAKEVRIRDLYAATKKAWSDPRKVQAVIKSFRAWVYDQAGIVLAPPKRAEGFSSLAEAA